MSTQVEQTDIINKIFLALEKKFNIKTSVLRIGNHRLIENSGFKINCNLKNPCYDKLKRLSMKKVNSGSIKL